MIVTSAPHPILEAHTVRMGRTTIEQGCWYPGTKEEAWWFKHALQVLYAWKHDDTAQPVTLMEYGMDHES